MVERYIRFILRNRWWVLLGSLIVVGVLTAGGNRIEFADNFRALIGEDDPGLKAFEAFEDTYAKSNTVLIAVESPTKDVFTPNTLQAIEYLTEKSWEAPYSTRVDSLTNATVSRSVDRDLYVAQLVEDASVLDDAEAEAIRELAMNDRDIAGRLVATDAEVAGVSINFVYPEDDPLAVSKISAFLTEMNDQFEAEFPGHKTYTTGEVVLNATTQLAIADGFATLVPISFVLMLVIIVVMFRSALGTLSIVIVFLCAILSTVGIAGWLGTVFTPMIAAMPITIMVLAVAHSIHILSPITSGLRDSDDKKEHIARSYVSHTWPIALTTATTIIGFLSLNSSEAPPIKDLGNYVAVGTFLIFCFSMTVFPALLSILPLRSKNKGFDVGDLFGYLADFVIARKNVLIVVMVTFGVVAALGIERNQIINNWTKQFDDSYEFRTDTDFVLQNFTGLNRLEFSLDSGVEGGITDVEYLKSVDQFAEWLRQQEHVEHVRSFADTMKRLNQNMNDDAPEFYRLPESKELATQYLLLYEFSIPFGRDLNDRMDVGKAATRLTITVSDVPDSTLRALATSAEGWLRENAPTLEIPATGLVVILVFGNERNLKRILLGTCVGMGLISLILIFCFKSLKYGLISLIPNFVPPILGFGLWGYFVGVMSLECAITIIIAFGILVDDTIHFLTKYRDARSRGESAEQAVRYAIETVGKALWTTTMVVVSGFMVFAISGFSGIYILGIMTSILVFLGVLIDFLLLPPILLWIDKNRDTQGSEAVALEPSAA